MTKFAFYQRMAELEEEGFVVGRYVITQRNGHTIKSRHYKLKAAGYRAVQEIQKFYVSRHLPTEVAAAA